MKTSSQPSPTSQVIFMIGGPAAGKSTVAAEKFSHLPLVDSDEWKKQHPDFDPKNVTEEIHRWSSKMATREFYGHLSEGIPFVMDGTGTNIEKYLTWIKNAHEAGYETRLVYVTCSLRTALKRNQERSRTVPQNILKEKHQQVGTAFEILSQYADHSEIINTEV